MQPKYEVLVVGGGPAGATAAFFLGQAGRKVLVLEKEHLPRYKTCGGAISAHVLEQFPFSFAPVPQAKVSAISYGLGKEMVTIPLPDSSLRMVMRADFDAYLLQQAPAEVRDGVTVRNVEENAAAVTITTVSGEKITADYLVAADGANSSVAHALGLRSKRVMAGAIEIEANAPAEVYARFAEAPLLIFGEVNIGYLWVFPKSDHLSVGIGALHPRPGEMQAVLERVMQRYGVALEGQQHGHPLPIYTRREQINTPRVFLAGDAAGLVDPFTGEGIRFAIKSGRLAAETILAGEPGRYALRVRREIHRNHQRALALTGMFYRFPRPFFELGLRNPVLSRALMEMVADRMGYGRLLMQSLGTFPLCLTTRKVPLNDPQAGLHFA